MFGLGVPEILVIALILLLIFGAKRLPSIGEGLGKTVKELRNIKKDMKATKEPEKVEALESGESKPSHAKAEGGNLADAIQENVTRKVTDKVLGQVPGIKQAKQLKDKADKIKKIVS